MLTLRVILWSTPLCSHIPGCKNSSYLNKPGSWQRKRTNTDGQIRSVVQSCSTLCDPMNCSMPGLPVHHLSDAIQPSHPLLSPSPRLVKAGLLSVLKSPQDQERETVTRVRKMKVSREVCYWKNRELVRDVENPK